MYYDEFFPFYAAFADPVFYAGERMQEREFALMKSWYPETARRIQEKIEEECEFLDYEGSRIYDEYPDRWMLQKECDRIRNAQQGEMDVQEMPSDVLDELIQVLFWQEISRRRCRRRRCRGY